MCCLWKRVCNIKQMQKQEKEYPVKYCSDECYRIGFKQNRNKTFMEKYGVSYALKREDILEKFKQNEYQKVWCLWLLTIKTG